MNGEKNQHSIWPELTAILLARLGFLWLLVLLSLLLPCGGPAFYALMGIAFIITIPYSLWLRNRMQAVQFAPLQFIVDLLLVTGLVYFTGGVGSELTLLYPLVILSAGIVGTPKQAAEITVLSIIIYLLMATLLSNHLIVEFTPVDALPGTGAGATALLLHSLLFAAFGGAGIYVAQRCRYVKGQEKQLEKTTRILLDHIPGCALLIDPAGRILFGSDDLCDILDYREQQLEAMTFSDLTGEGPQPIPEKYGTTAWLLRRGSPPLPVAYRSTDFRLPETALRPQKGRTLEKMDVTLILLQDISMALETERQLHQVERITAATRIAGELAHEIRTPLTALSASIQLLRRYEEHATSADWLPNSPRRQDRTELFGHIEDASRRMDTVVKNFVDFAEFSPADLISIIKLDSIEENQGYIGHLNTIGRSFKDGKNTHSG